MLGKLCALTYSRLWEVDTLVFDHCFKACTRMGYHPGTEFLAAVAAAYLNELPHMGMKALSNVLLG